MPGMGMTLTLDHFRGVLAIPKHVFSGFLILLTGGYLNFVWFIL